MPPVASPTLFTIGHSTRSFEAFIHLLKAHGVTALADVRRFPRSRKYPHFNDEQLAAALPRVGLRYVPMKALGGRRQASKDSVNTGWRSEGFRGYADHMQTPEFAGAIDGLVAVASQAPTAIMCAEAVPWRCHRSLISDAMVVRGWRVLDIMSETSAPPHELTRFARVDGTTITYPAGGGDGDRGEEEASLFR